jgi:hypothetical protein
VDIIAAIAADTGEQVIPREADMVDTLSGLSGRILDLVAISEMMGRREYEVCAVPARTQNSQVVMGP